MNCIYCKSVQGSTGYEDWGGGGCWKILGLMVVKRRKQDRAEGEVGLQCGHEEGLWGTQKEPQRWGREPLRIAQAGVVARPCGLTLPVVGWRLPLERGCEVRGTLLQRAVGTQHHWKLGDLSRTSLRSPQSWHVVHVVPVCVFCPILWFWDLFILISVTNSFILIVL